MATMTERVNQLELNYGVMNAELKADIQEMKSMVRVLFDGTAGHDIASGAKIKRLEEIQDDVAKVLDKKGDKEFVGAEAEKHAKEVVALALVDAKKIEDEKTKAIEERFKIVGRDIKALLSYCVAVTGMFVSAVLYMALHKP